ncbi:MAG: stage II sporulation protein M [Bacteroidales bacterium]|nr:stage II sporulation protein M [Bacteroidales bacterium]MBN2757689.1 stage II sporulation protein M [Bacteroidales bacterium]
MKEIAFINSNINRWKKFEKDIDSKLDKNPDEIAALYIQITDDLSYCRTFYPESNTLSYLNQLASKAHLNIYKNKKENKNKLKIFWKYEFPLILYTHKKFIYISLIIFLISALIGSLSAANDNTFVRLILGDQYVDMTIDNIQKGDPMAVYKQAIQTDMFLAITFNNIKVSFMAFIMGIFIAFGTVYILLYNGIMLGSFQYFFYDYGLLKHSVLTIWIHGTLEIFAIIMAGAAGLILGSSILFPNTYSRLQSFKFGVKTGIKIIIGIIPLFIVAGFLEGFVTRYTEAPNFLRAGIIIASLIFIVWYFFIYPNKLYKIKA